MHIRASMASFPALYPAQLSSLRGNLFFFEKPHRNCTFMNSATGYVSTVGQTGLEARLAGQTVLARQN